MSTNWERLAPIAVIAGAVDLLVSGIIPYIYLARLGSQSLGEDAKRLAAATAQVSGITKMSGIGVPLFAAALIVVGIGLIRSTPWARTATRVWSFSALAFLVAAVGLHIGFVWPHIEAARQAAIQGGAAENTLHGYDAMQFAVIRIALVRLPFPIILLRRLQSSS